MKSDATRLQIVRSDEPAAVMRRPVAVAAIKDAKTRRAVCRVLRAAGADIVLSEAVADIASWVRRTAVDLVIVDLDVPAPEATLLEELAELGPQAPAVVLLSNQLLPQSLSHLLTSSRCRNVIAKVAQEGTFDVGELLLTVRKILDRDILGAEKYVRWGSMLHTVTISDSTQKHETLEQLSSFLEELDCERRLLLQLETVAEEFIMNALYNAPVAADGSRPFASLPRTEPAVVPADHAARLEFCSDGRLVAIACRDRYGSLTPERISESFGRAIRAGEDQVSFAAGGAGIGLYMVYMFVDQMIVNIQPGKVTEFIGVVDITVPFRMRAPRAKSVNIFVVPD